MAIALKTTSKHIRHQVHNLVPYTLEAGILLFHRIVISLRSSRTENRRAPACPQLAPAREHTLVERHANRIHLVDRPVKVRLEVPVCTKRLADVSRSAVFS